MKYRQCFQCSKDLPFSAGGGAARCPFCGAVNESAEPVEPMERSGAGKKSKRGLVDGALIGALTALSPGSDSGGCQ